MKTLVLDSGGRLRNGWWALLFILACAVFGLAQARLGKALVAAGLPKGQWRLALAALAVLGATWLCTRLRREPLATVGLSLDARWWRHALVGTAIGCLQISLAAVALWQLGGVRFQLDPSRTVSAVAGGFVAFAGVALIEELLFRGFVFQRLRDGLGAVASLVVMAALFALAHWSNPGMDGAVKAWATLDTFVGALALGLAYLRTNGLALPIGIHLGWNWMQGSVLGFGVSGTAENPGWLKPAIADDPSWFTGGAFGLEASAFAVIVDAGLLVALLMWRGRGEAASTADGRVTPLPTTAPSMS